MSWHTEVVRRSPRPLPPDATRDALLADVRAAPDEDGPRWVAADWYLQQEDPADRARGELIGIQLTLAGLDADDPRIPALRDEENALLDRYKRVWVGRFKGARIEYGPTDGKRWVRSNPTRWTFERGFVDTVQMALADFLDNAEVLLGEEPVRMVDLTQARGRVGRFVQECPRLEGLRGLSLSRQKLGDEDAEALWTCTRFDALESLHVSNCGLGVKRSARTFALEARMPRLTALNVAANKIKDKGVASLATNPVLQSVEQLVLVSNGIGSAGARALVESPHLDAVRDLRVGTWRLSDADTGALQRRFGAALTA